ncbi:alcohol dehydrogenase catalytic domain-containing protein [Dactylosporangium sp. AC04546]|uniref:zinc-dependent alcohol dehydrogenase n=1 Tax=Dactylosporangium sp. AC04546 TaxID=2862460 RepID=UPI001EE1248B|nr:alcohol dehydrogenase catalytic domain-containing protein [Dactylosporangium sp. AC04546]WVK79579.1 alcohol dehydrogenase catalytic domain-containing protein [Dactylosporangium sp. AC04546]
MRALLYARPLELVVTELDVPVPADDEVLVRVAAAGVCGSEVEGFATQSPFRKPPLVMGHEFAGHRVDDGTLVTVNPLVACGACGNCRRGRTNICEHRSILGIHQAGGFAEYVAVPRANVHPLPAGVSPQRGAFVEPLANAVHAANLVADRLAPDARVGVIGAGMLGTAVLLVLRSRGLTGIHVADLAEQRLTTAVQAGAEHTGQRLTGTFDVILDTVGTAGTRADSVALLHPGGATVWLGLHAAESDVDCRAMIREEKAVLGSFCYTDAEFAAAVPLAAGLDERWLELRDLGDGVAVFEELMRGPSARIKTMLVPGGIR